MELRELDISCVVSTAAGMFGLWQPEAFASVVDLDSWEDEVAEDSALIRHIQAGEFTPINVGGDGVFQVSVRGRTEGSALSERERRYLEVSSDPYLLISRGMLELGGIEAAGSYTEATKEWIPLAAGRYSVIVHLIAWKAEPGAIRNGNASAGAMPDFVVELSGAQTADIKYRSKVETFER